MARRDVLNLPVSAGSTAAVAAYDGRARELPAVPRRSARRDRVGPRERSGVRDGPRAARRPRRRRLGQGRAAAPAQEPGGDPAARVERERARARAPRRRPRLARRRVPAGGRPVRGVPPRVAGRPPRAAARAGLLFLHRAVARACSSPSSACCRTGARACPATSTCSRCTPSPSPRTARPGAPRRPGATAIAIQPRHPFAIHARGARAARAGPGGRGREVARVRRSPTGRATAVSRATSGGTRRSSTSRPAASTGRSRSSTRRSRRVPARPRSTPPTRRRCCGGCISRAWTSGSAGARSPTSGRRARPTRSGRSSTCTR